MTELLPITITGIILSLLHHKFSKYDYLNSKYTYKEKLFYMLLVICMVLFVGLRTLYNDTLTYRQSYDAISPSTPLFHDISWNLGDNPGFTITNRILKKLGFSTQSYIMIYSVFVVATNLWFFKKYSDNFPFTIFLYITFAGYIFALAAIKQCVAMAFGMLAVDSIIQKKCKLFVFYILLGSTYHPYILMFLILPFMLFRPWSKRTYIFIALFAVIGILMENMLGTVLRFTDMLGEDYNLETLSGEGVNPLRLLAISVPIPLSYIVRKQIGIKRDIPNYVFLNLTMLNAEIMYVALFGTAIYFARLANYFLPYQALAVPWILKHFEPKTKKYITFIALLCYGVFFIFSNAILESFDQHYHNISLMEYLRSIFIT